MEPSRKLLGAALALGMELGDELGDALTLGRRLGCPLGPGIVLEGGVVFSIIGREVGWELGPVVGREVR